MSDIVAPYAPPRSQVADVHGSVDEFQPVSYWGVAGRLGRLRYLAAMTSGYLVLTAAYAVAMGLGIAKSSPALAGGVIGLGFLVYAVFGILTAIQRSHDMGWSGWTVLLMIIPLVPLVWIFNGGSRGANEYGAPPPPNTIGVKILAFIFPVIMGIGVLAAVSIPAYQDYTKRAKAKQAEMQQTTPPAQAPGQQTQ